MIKKEVIKGMFWERNSIDVEPFIDNVVRLICYPISDTEKEEIFIGEISYDPNFPMLNVYFPWREDEKASFARETAVSPKIDDPKAYYILKGIENVPEEISEKWFKAGKNFVKSLEK